MFLRMLGGITEKLNHDYIQRLSKTQRERGEQGDDRVHKYSLHE